MCPHAQGTSHRATNAHARPACSWDSRVCAATSCPVAGPGRAVGASPRRGLLLSSRFWFPRGQHCRPPCHAWVRDVRAHKRRHGGEISLPVRDDGKENVGPSRMTDAPCSIFMEKPSTSLKYVSWRLLPRLFSTLPTSDCRYHVLLVAGELGQHLQLSVGF